MTRSAARPNVVLFISDQQRADTMPGARPAALDGIVETPHLDWLASQPLEDLKVEPQGLGPIYRNVHGQP